MRILQRERMSYFRRPRWRDHAGRCRQWVRPALSLSNPQAAYGAAPSGVESGVHLRWIPTVQTVLVEDQDDWML